MPIPSYAAWMLEQEARALLTRLARVKPFALQESTLPAAGISSAAQVAIESYLTVGRRHLRNLVHEFLTWLASPQAAWSDAEGAQRKFTILRLQFNAVVTQFDVFENVITQRSESQTGVWLSGLDVVSEDALRLNGHYYAAPPVICYLDRGAGASIRRARTRLPGGGDNPVAIVKVPRERMVGSGIASSLIHEVGHQAAALMGLVESLRPLLQGLAGGSSADAAAWTLWDRWISEIVADFWSVARVGVASTLGLMGVVSLPRPFVFRISSNDPHPAPWIRVKLSAAIGETLYPQPVWRQLTELWTAYYPVEGLGQEQRQVLAMLERTMPALVALLVNHRPPALRGHSLVQVLDTRESHPLRLTALLARWRERPQEMYETRPILVFAAIGQGRAEGKITPEEESTVIGKLLTYWALKSTLQEAAGCAAGHGHRCRCHDSVNRDTEITSTRRALWKV
jgi:hypothetical protein